MICRSETDVRFKMISTSTPDELGMSENVFILNMTL